MKKEKKKKRGNFFRITRILRQIGQSDSSGRFHYIANIVVRSVISLGRKVLFFLSDTATLLCPPCGSLTITFFFSSQLFFGLFPYSSRAFLHVRQMDTTLYIYSLISGTKKYTAQKLYAYFFHSTIDYLHFLLSLYIERFIHILNAKHHYLHVVIYIYVCRQGYIIAA